MGLLRGGAATLRKRALRLRREHVGDIRKRIHMAFRSWVVCSMGMLRDGAATRRKRAACDVKAQEMLGEHINNWLSYPVLLVLWVCSGVAQPIFGSVLYVYGANTSEI